MAKIVTISREFGSGGRTIGKAVAQKLGVPYYDKALIKQVAEETGFDPAYIENAGEYAQEKSIFSYFTSFAGSTGVMGGMSASDFLWCMQRKVILDKAEEGPCVIVGRCADFILKDRTDALHVFIHADPAFRADRIVRVYGESERSPAQRLKDKDGRRSVNYKHFNGLAQGLIPIVGYNWGAGNRRRTTEALRVALSGAVALMLCGTAVFCLFPAQLLGLFSAGEELLAIGVPGLRTISLVFARTGVTVTIGYYFSGLGDGTVNMITSLLRQLVLLLPLAWAFGRLWGVSGVWYAFWISEAAAFAFAVARCVRDLRSVQNTQR